MAATASPPAPATRPATTRPAATRATPTTRPAVLNPRSVEDLRSIERQVQAVVKKASPATVGVQVGAGQGSGVIVSKDGYVLTAAHVSGDPGRDVTLILADGRRVKGKTLGLNRNIDAGMIKISDGGGGGDYPHVELGDSAPLKLGQWVVALGHPGGYRKDRPPVVRLGRVLTNSNNLVGTDCTLVGGDSGGPLFDLNGNVIGIHSRIGASTLANIHVPVDTYSQTWDRLAKGEAWGDRFGFGAVRGPMLGVNGETHDKGFKVTVVSPGSPAAKAGIKPGDVITKMDGKVVEGQQSLADIILRRKAGDEVKIQVLRGEETLDLKATLARREE